MERIERTAHDENARWRRAHRSEQRHGHLGVHSALRVGARTRGGGRGGCQQAELAQQQHARDGAARFVKWGIERRGEAARAGGGEEGGTAHPHERRARETTLHSGSQTPKEAALPIARRAAEQRMASTSGGRGQPRIA